MNDIVNEVQKQGLYVVNNQDEDHLEEQYYDLISKVDILCDKVDPVETPYKSKYEGRELLDKLCQQLEANQTIARLEQNKTVIKMLDWILASMKVRLGLIAFECEEPHTAQIELESACQFYFPTIVDSIMTITTDDDDESNESSNDNQAALISTLELESLVPEIYVQHLITHEKVLEVIVDALKCLNLLGILWAGRARVKRSFLYLFLALKFYNQIKKSNFKRGKYFQEFENTFTHTLFYLAQAYGNIGDSAKSSMYCKETLQRQYDQGLNDPKKAFEWVKNCLGMVDYYISSHYYRRASLTLSSIEHIYKINVLNKRPSVMSNESNEEYDGIRNTDILEFEASVHRRYIRLDLTVLRLAFEREQTRLNFVEMNEEFSEADIENDEDRLEEEFDRNDALQFNSNDNLSCINHGNSSDTNNDLSMDSIQLNFTPSSATNDVVFKGIHVTPLPYLKIRDIKSFEVAREIFLRASSRIEAAKKILILDGFVTDHVFLLLDHSKLYHYIAVFEKDNKRKLAMESRRVDLLKPLLSQLSRSSYEVLHKHISYELGETYLTLLDIKLDKLRHRVNDRVTVGTGAWDLDESSIKAAEKKKINDYCKGAMAMFCHFTGFYSKSSSNNLSKVLIQSNSPYEDMSLFDLVKDEAFCLDPDESLISESEVRLFLNAHFLSCRVMSKVLTSSSVQGGMMELTSPTLSAHATGSKAWWVMQCLRRYEWLCRFVPEFCRRKGLNPHEVFGEELKVCEEMSRLLPSKIDRLHVPR